VSKPTGPANTYLYDLPANPQSVEKCRTLVHILVRRWGLYQQSDLLDRMEECAVTLVTVAVEDSSGGCEPIHVRFAREETRLRFDVHMYEIAEPGADSTDVKAQWERIAAELADRTADWGYETLDAGGRHGWCTVDIPEEG